MRGSADALLERLKAVCAGSDKVAKLLHARYAGSRAEALRVYEHCRRLLSEELGVPPAPQIEAVYLAILRS